MQQRALSTPGQKPVKSHTVSAATPAQTLSKATEDLQDLHSWYNAFTLCILRLIFLKCLYGDRTTLGPGYDIKQRNRQIQSYT